MVFESIVVDILNKSIGNYVQNLDTSQLKLGIWGGDVVLNNLQLKEHALSDLNLPIKVQWGVLGKLTLKIPWKNLYTAPVIATIQDLHVLIIPVMEEVYDAKKEAKALWDAKQAQLQKIENAKRIDAEKNKPPEADTFAEKLIAQVIKNLQVKITDIHIRYEDTISAAKLDMPFSVGFTLHNLSFDTTDDKWVPRIIQENVKFIHKIVSLDSLAVYWNPNTKLLGNKDKATLPTTFNSLIATKFKQDKHISYLLGPIYLTARLKLNPKPENDGSNFSIPKLFLNVVLDSLNIAITKLQYQEILMLLQNLEWMQVGAIYRKYRPVKVPYKGNAKIWWKFAYKCILEEEVRRRRRNWSWKHIKKHRKNCKTYKELYIQKLKAGKKVTKETLQQLEDLEKELQVFDIVIMRSQAEVQFKRDDDKSKIEASKRGWFSGWGGGGKGASPEGGIAKQFEAAMTAKEKAKLYEAIGYQENAVPAAYPKEFVEVKLIFEMKNLHINVRNDSRRIVDAVDVTSLKLQEIFCTVQQMNGSKTLRANVKVGSLSVTAMPSSAITEKPEMVKTILDDKKTKVPLLEILYESNPLDQKCDQRLHISAQPLEVVYNAQTVEALSLVFASPESIQLYQLQQAAWSKFEDFKSRSTAGLQHAIENHKYLELNLNIKAPYFIIPELGMYNRNNYLIIIDMGRVEMKSIQREVMDRNKLKKYAAANTPEDEVFKKLVSQVYDKYAIDLKGMQILLAPPGENWTKARTKTTSNLHIWNSTNLQLQFQACMILDDPRLPKIKIVGKLPSIELNLTDEKIKTLGKIAVTFPPPTGEPPAAKDSSGRRGSVYSVSKSITQDLKVITSEVQKNLPTSSPTKKPTIQLTELEVQFEVEKVLFSLSTVAELKINQVLAFSAETLGFKMESRTHDMVINAYIGGVTLKSLEFKDPDDKDLYLIATPMSTGLKQHLLKIKYIATTKKNPLFATEYKSTKQNISIDFTSLDIVLHLEAILSLMEVGNNISSSLQKYQEQPAAIKQPEKPSLARKMSRFRSTSIKSETPVRSAAKVTFITPESSPKVKKKVDDKVIDMKVSAKFNVFSLIICNKHRSISSLFLQEIEASAAFNKAFSDIKARLKSISISDPNPKAAYKQIVTVTGKEVLDFSLKMFNDATSGAAYADMNKVDMQISLNVGASRIVVIFKYIMEILTFVNNFQDMKKQVAEASALAAEAALENVQNVIQKAMRMKLSVKMKAPLIIIPKNSKSLNVVIVDLGNLTVANKFSTVKMPKGSSNPPVLENLSIDLQNLRMSRGIVDQVTKDILSECALVKPMTFTLKIVRNLSAGWYKEKPDMDVNGRLGVIDVAMSQEDYNIILSVLSENFSEQPSDSLTVVTTVEVPVDTGVPAGAFKPLPYTEEFDEDIPLDMPTPLQAANLPTYKFSWQMDGIKAVLYLGKTAMKEGTTCHDEALILASFDMEVVVLNGEYIGDGSVWANVALVSCILEDPRPSRKEGIIRLLEKKDTGRGKKMIDITFKKTTGNTFVLMKISSFTLIACPEYLMALAQFFTQPASDRQSSFEGTTAPTTASNVVKAAPSPVPSAEPAAAVTSMEIKIEMEKPDIILVENMDDLNTEAIILQCKLEMKVKSNSEFQSINGCIQNLQLFSCAYNPQFRNETKAEILSPCDICIIAKTPAGEGMHANVHISEMHLHMAPATVRLMSSLSSGFMKQLGPAVEEEAEPVDYSDLWQVKNNNDFKFWFLKTELAEEALETMIVPPKVKPLKEQLLLNIEYITINLEIGVGNRTVPMIMLDAKYTAEVLNWSSALYLLSSLNMEVMCYNEKLALWEPLIERVETPQGSKMYTINFEMKFHDPYQDISQLDEPDIDEMTFGPPKCTYSISSPDMMEICVTKTGLDVMSSLGKAFTDAVNLAPVAQGSKPKAPFLVKNETGLSVSLVLKDQEFMISDEAQKNISEVLLEPHTSVSLCLKMETTDIQRRSVLKLQEYAQDKKLMMKIEQMNAVRMFSVKQADKRFFLLPHKTYPGDQWGIVVDIVAVYGCRIITLRSLVQVKNKFEIPIEVYYWANEGSELKCCGEVEPKGMYNVPMTAIYTQTNELFFRPKDDKYAVSSTPFTWKELVKRPTMNTVLHCLPRKENEGQAFLINAVGEIDQVYYEETAKKTLASTCYIINLQATVVFKNVLPFPVKCSFMNSEDDIIVEGGKNVELHHAIIDSTGITITITDYLGKQWSCTNFISTPTQELNVWTFETGETGDANVTLDLGMYTDYEYGSLTMALYSPFWMVNLTGLTLNYAADDLSNTIRHHHNYSEPILFSFKAKNFFARKKAALQIEDAEWSDRFSIDVVGSSGTVACQHHDGFQYEVGVQIELSGTGLTKIVKFTPYFVLVNNSNVEIEIKELNTSTWFTVPVKECIPFWPKAKKQLSLVAKVKSTPEETKPFTISKSHTTLLRIDNKYGAIQADCQVSESSVLVTVSVYDESVASIRLINHTTDSTITYYQSGVKIVYCLSPSETVLYTWDDPSGNRELVWSNIDRKEHKFNLQSDGLGEFHIDNKTCGYWVSFLSNTQRILLFTNDLSLATQAQCAGELEQVEQNYNLSLQGMGLSLVDNIKKFELLYISITSTDIIWESCKERSMHYKPVSTNLGLQIEAAYQKYQSEVIIGAKPDPLVVIDAKHTVDFNSYLLLKPQRRKIRRSFQPGIWLSYKVSPQRMWLHARINRFQMDNQMTDCVFPTILAPVAPTKSVAVSRGPKPFTEISLIRFCSQHGNVDRYKYFKILIQEFHIKVEQGFIYSCLDFFSSNDTNTDELAVYNADLKLAKVTLGDMVAIKTSNEQEIFFDLLHFSPLKVHITFSMVTGSSDNSKQAAQFKNNIFNLFIQSVGVTLTDIQDVIFRLSYFERQNKLMSWSQLQSEATSHYVGQALKQMYVLILGLDVLGNPFGLVVGLTQGVEDFFYEPIQGAIQGPEEFAEGLVLGVKSLVGHAVGGAAGAMSRITGTIGKGVAVLTLDEDYQRRRRENNLARSNNIQEELARSGKGLVMGVFDGVTGVFVKPITGARQEGVEGFFKGMGKGMVGLVTRPTAGVIDFASGTLESVKRATEVGEEVSRTRPPRYFHKDGVLRNYNKHEAEGHKLINQVEKGKFASTDSYLAHASITQDGKTALVITDKRILLVSKGDILGQWNCNWQLIWNDMAKKPEASETGITIFLKAPKKKKFGLFGSADDTKFINIKSAEITQWLMSKIDDIWEERE